MRFRKKPVVIEARQWDGTAEGATPIIDWMLTNGGIARFWDDARIVIDTLEGHMDASPGDWIIKGVAGEFYPCKPDIFEQTYEAVEPSVEPLECRAARWGGFPVFEGPHGPHRFYYGKVGEYMGNCGGRSGEAVDG